MADASNSTRCPMCQCPIRVDRLERHLARVHGPAYYRNCQQRAIKERKEELDETLARQKYDKYYEAISQQQAKEDIGVTEPLLAEDENQTTSSSLSEPKVPLHRKCDSEISGNPTYRRW